MANEIRYKLNNQILYSGASNLIVYDEDVIPLYAVNDDTIGYWTFNNNSLDSSGNGFHALTGTSVNYTSSNGLFHNSMVMDYGAGSDWNARANTPHPFSTGFTFGGWFRHTPNTAVYQGLWYYGNTAANGVGAFWNGASGNIFIMYGGVTTQNTITSLSNSTWYNLVFTVDVPVFGGGATSCNSVGYANGVKGTTFTQGIISPSDYDFQIGCASNGGNFTNQNFDGLIEECFYENRIWSDAEVLAYYENAQNYFL